MSHNLSFNQKTGNAEMAFVGQTPWHRYGTRIHAAPTSEEMIVASGLDYPLKKELLVTQRGGIEVPSAAIFRGDTQEYMSTVGEDYEIIPNRKLFTALNPLIQDKLLNWETAGALFGGRIVWVLAKIPTDVTVRGELIKGYVLISNGHDGWHALRLDLTPIRVVCWNTLSFATGMSEKSEGNTAQSMIKHTKNWSDKLDIAVANLQIAREELVTLGDIFESFAQAPMSPSKAEVMFEALVPDNPTAKRNTRTDAKRRDLVHLFKHGTGNQGDSLWDWYNAVTEYADGGNESRSLGVRGADDARLKSLYQGLGKKMKVTAYSMALAEVS